jgi:hypothetical protein
MPPGWQIAPNKTPFSIPIRTGPATFIFMQQIRAYGSAGFQIYQEGDGDGSGDAAGAGVDRLFSPP